MGIIELLDFSGQSMPSVNRPRSGCSLGAAIGQSSTQHSDTLVGDILSEAQVSMEPEYIDPDADNTIVKILKVVKKKDSDPDSRKAQDPVSVC